MTERHSQGFFDALKKETPVTPAQLSAIRERATAALNYKPSPSDEDADCPLCKDYGSVDARRYSAKGTTSDTVFAYGIGKGLALAEAWIEQGPQDVLALHAEVERLTAERDAAFRRGAEAMRESLALAVIGPMANAIRALPLPEDK